METIYRSPEAESAVMDLYRGFLADWPVPYEEVTVRTRYGNANVICSGPADGSPVLLLHAASMASTSWLPNVGALAAAGFRTYAVDHIGEAGKSRLDQLGEFPKSASEVGELYAGIAADLGLERTAVVGASAGGHAALRFALAAPGVVTRIGLLGPMGVVPLGLRTALRMMMVSMFPNDTRVSTTNHWALGRADSVQGPYGPWFEAVLRGVSSPPRVARPVALKPMEKAAIPAPVLLVLGTRDNLVGDPRRAAAAAGSFTDLRVEVLESAHLPGVEQAEAVNELLIGFLGEEAQ